MKLIFNSLVIFSMLIGANVASAAFLGPNNAPQYKSIQDVKAAPVDDAKIVLKGNIVEKTGHEKYLFKDVTSTITIEIDDKKFAMIEDITPETLVEIRGKVDVRRDKTVEIDVKFIKIVK